MQLDRFYRLPQLQRFVQRRNQKGIEAVVDIGANVGDVLLLLHRYFPEARIIGFEPVPEYFRIAQERTRSIGQIELHNKAVTGEHRFFDDLGQQPRPCRADLVLAEALPQSGAGWRGGSIIAAADHPILAAGTSDPGYRRRAQKVMPIDLTEILTDARIAEIDLVKLDCEGCENSVLGTADPETLRRIRFITGEYHGLARFYRAMRHRLFLTHKVFIQGGSSLGAFFAERRDGDRNGILQHRTVCRRLGTESDLAVEYNPLRKRFTLLPRLLAAADSRP